MRECVLMGTEQIANDRDKCVASRAARWARPQSLRTPQPSLRHPSGQRQRSRRQPVTSNDGSRGGAQRTRVVKVAALLCSCTTPDRRACRSGAREEATDVQQMPRT